MIYRSNSNQRVSYQGLFVRQNDSPFLDGEVVLKADAGVLRYNDAFKNFIFRGLVVPLTSQDGLNLNPDILASYESQIEEMFPKPRPKVAGEKFDAPRASHLEKILRALSPRLVKEIASANPITKTDRNGKIKSQAFHCFLDELCDKLYAPEGIGYKLNGSILIPRSELDLTASRSYEGVK